jgi:hypothetical protein
MNPQQAPLPVWTLLAAERSLGALPYAGARRLVTRLREEAAHGADALVRMQDREGYFYLACMTPYKGTGRVICSHNYWTHQNGADYRCGWRSGGGLAIAALARAGQASVAGDFSAVQYREAARRGFAHLEAHGLEYLVDRKENMLDDYCALLAAVELHAAGPEAGYLQAARRRADSLLGRLMDDAHGNGWWRADDAGARPFYHASDAGLPAMALARYLEIEPDSARRAAVVAGLVRAARHLLAITGEVSNPFHYPRQLVSSPDRPGFRRRFFIPHVNETGYWWQGENARLGSIACQCLVTARLVESSEPELAGELAVFAQAQLDWVLGLNPYDTCMLYGRGRNNVEFFEDLRNAPGGIVNGITGGMTDEEDIDFFPPAHATDLMNTWRWGEEWLPHAAWCFLAVAQMADWYQEEPLVG